jgi:hypothetical protein
MGLLMAKQLFDNTYDKRLYYTSYSPGTAGCDEDHILVQIQIN